MVAPKDPIKRELWKKRISESKKGVPGRKPSKESIEKMRQIKIGKPRPQHVIDALIKSNKGKKHTEEHKRKVLESRIRNGNVLSGERNPMYGVSRKGSLSPNFGKKWTNPKVTDEHRRKNSESHKGLQVGEKNGMYGKPSAFKNKKHTEKTLEIMREKRKNLKIPYRDSKPEKMMQLALVNEGIKFEKHKPFKIGKSWHQVDIFIEPNIIVEVDGVHWHTPYESMKRDLYQSQELNIMGYHVIRIRDLDIIKNSKECAKNIINLIKQLQMVIKLV